MAFKLAKLMDEGTANPAVARLSVGISDLLTFTTLGKQERDSLFACAFEAMQLVVQAQGAAKDLLEEFDGIDRQIEAGEIREQPSAIEVPSAMKLAQAANFLLLAKKALQAATKVFELGWGKKITAAHYHRALEWARADLGLEHPLTQLLDGDQDWVKRVITLRNEEEHPKSAKAFISNYDLNKTPAGGFEATPPRFFDGTSVRKELTDSSAKLLTFVEQLFVCAVSEKLIPGFLVVEVPEIERPTACPVRFAVARGRAPPKPSAIPPTVTGVVDPFWGPEPVATIFQGRRFCGVGSTVYPREVTETFHEFIVFLLKETLGTEWLKSQLDRPSPDRHAIAQWLSSWAEQTQTFRPKDAVRGQRYGAMPNGSTQEAMALAYDLYKLRQVFALHENSVVRLRDPNQFQAVRYEISVAATFVRCGFGIEWTVDENGSGTAFTARHERSAEAVAVHTVSRRCPGTLNEPGLRPELLAIRFDAVDVVSRALEHRPRDKPYAVFVDVNLPPGIPNFEARFVEDAESVFASAIDTKSAADPFSLLGVTNCGWHYAGPQPAATGCSYRVLVGKNPEFPIRSEPALRALVGSLKSLGHVPQED